MLWEKKHPRMTAVSILDHGSNDGTIERNGGNPEKGTDFKRKRN